MTSQKTIWMISSGRGGAGKSFFALALAGALEMRSETFAILDGDARTNDVFTSFTKKVPARTVDFRSLRPDSHTCLNDGDYEYTLTQLLRTSNHIIINTPDGADNTLIKWFDLTLKHTETHNITFKFIYLISDRQDGLKMLPSLESRFQFLYPFLNSHFGSLNVFEEFNRNHRARFNNVPIFPRLRQHELRLVFENNTYPAEASMAKRPGQNTFHYPVLTRARLRRWQSDFNNIINPIINNTTLPNTISNYNSSQ
jgi:hypothetical protein